MADHCFQGNTAAALRSVKATDKKSRLRGGGNGCGLGTAARLDGSRRDRVEGQPLPGTPNLAAERSEVAGTPTRQPLLAARSWARPPAPYRLADRLAATILSARGA